MYTKNKLIYCDSQFLHKVPLLQERTYWESDLVVEAKEAFTIIFQEMSQNGGMFLLNM